MHFLPSFAVVSSLALLFSSVSAAPHTGSTLNKRCTNSATDRACWGDYDLSTNYYDDGPDTGVTVEVSILVTLLNIILTELVLV
jgi:hypothetical protein